MSVLILGASGFIGRHLARDIARGGQRVIAVDRQFPDFLDAAFAGVEQVERDLFDLDEAALGTLIAGAETVYHFVWSSIPATASAAPEMDLYRNVGLMIRLLRAIEATGGRLIFSSSGGTVYGRGDGRPHLESDVLCPIGAYGAGKAAAELYAGVFREAHGLDVRVARLANPFGTGQLGGQLGAVTRFTIEAMAGRPVEMWGAGDVVRDYVHISDVVDGLRLLGEVTREKLGPHAVYNIGSGIGTSLNGIVSILNDVLGRPVAVERHPGRGFDVQHNVLDPSRMISQLGWHPRFSLREGISMMVEELRRSPGSAFSDRRDRPAIQSVPTG